MYLHQFSSRKARDTSLGNDKNSKLVILQLTALRNPPNIPISSTLRKNGFELHPIAHFYLKLFYDLDSNLGFQIVRLIHKSSVLLVTNNTIGLDISVNDVNVKDISSSLANTLPNRVVSHPIGNAAVLGVADH
jgi:hypothetical protein